MQKKFLKLEKPCKELWENMVAKENGNYCHLCAKNVIDFTTLNQYEIAEKMKLAPEVLDKRGVDFEYEGEMAVDVALNPRVMAKYPFNRLSGPANVLVVPARHSSSISVKLMQEMAGATVIGPILTGVDRPIQICPTVSSVNDILNMALLAASKVG